MNSIYRYREEKKRVRLNDTKNIIFKELMCTSVKKIKINRKSNGNKRFLKLLLNVETPQSTTLKLNDKI